jgi:hypothetical protein
MSVNNLSNPIKVKENSDPARSYRTLHLLRDGHVIDFEDLILTPSNDDIEAGDCYIAQRNTGAHLFTAKFVDSENGWIVPQENGYSFDLHETIKVLVTPSE